MLRSKVKITQDMIVLLDKWRHTGFNACCGSRILPRQKKSKENPARYTCPPLEGYRSAVSCRNLLLMKIPGTGHTGLVRPNSAKIRLVTLYFSAWYPIWLLIFRLIIAKKFVALHVEANPDNRHKPKLQLNFMEKSFLNKLFQSEIIHKFPRKILGKLQKRYHFHFLETSLSSIPKNNYPIPPFHNYNQPNFCFFPAHSLQKARHDPRTLELTP